MFVDDSEYDHTSSSFACAHCEILSPFNADNEEDEVEEVKKEVEEERVENLLSTATHPKSGYLYK